MKEQIYTIPVNEAFDKSCGCPFCDLYLELEKNRLEYTLGAAMMEPDARTLTNSLGFCTRHFNMLLKMPNKLSFALILDTHIQELRKKHDLNKTAVLSNNRKSLFYKKDVCAADKLSASLKENENSCYVCSQISNTFNRYTEVFFYMYENDKEFLKKFENVKYFCLPHYKLLVENSKKYLSAKKCDEFVRSIFEKQQTALQTLNDDIHKFTLKFDYRNRDLPWGTAKDAPKRCAYALGGKMYEDDTEPEEDS